MMCELLDDDYLNAHRKQYLACADEKELAHCLNILITDYLSAINLDGIQICADCMIEEKMQAHVSALTDILTGLDGRERESSALAISFFVGSLLEAILQVFLIAFRTDFEGSEWKKWDKETCDNVVSRIRSTLDDMVDEGLIDSKKKKTVYQAVKQEVLYRKDTRLIERMMLNELIEFYKKEDVLEGMDVSAPRTPSMPRDHKKLYDLMRKIQAARNNVHVFTKNSLPDYSESINALRAILVVLTELIFRVKCNSGNSCKAMIEQLLFDDDSLHASVIDIGNDCSIFCIGSQEPGTDERGSDPGLIP